jgi:hydroxyacylglutathione hydrolase
MPRSAFGFRGVNDGDILPLGNDAIAVWHTPGHTPEHICLVVADKTRADEPWLVFTGHTLMVGDLVRTVLASSAEEGDGPCFSLTRSARRPQAGQGPKSAALSIAVRCTSLHAENRDG